MVALSKGNIMQGNLMRAKPQKPDLELAFDVGHSSIGWAVLQSQPLTVNLLGCGSVIFPSDDCLASQRRAFRRQRRHIRATRLRIARMRCVFTHLERLNDGSLSPGGLLFGQLVPRFDNRIIARCPITFERLYESVKAETGDEEHAKHEAEKRAKVPGADCVEFHRFRWAMELAKIKVATRDAREPRNLTAAERQAVNVEMEKKGFLTPKQLRDAVRTQTGGVPDNLEQILTHPDAERALVLDPVRRYIHSDQLVSMLWQVLPERLQKRLRGQWRRGHAIPVSELLDACGEVRAAAEAACERYLDAQNTKKRKKDEPLTREALLRTPLHVKPPNRRAPHTRHVMREVVDFVFSTDRHPAEEGGPLYRSEAIRQAQLQRALDEQTNNHLVRHRLKILERLHGDLLKEYAGDDRARITRVTIEVNRDVREMSGKTAQEQAKVLGQQLSHFKGVAKKLGEAYEGLGIHVGPGLIRKGRIAEDLGWICPYTGKGYDALDLLHRRVDKDHIIPRSDRASDSLASLVITFSEINKMKGKRTAVRFVEEFQGQPVQGLP
jgi:CRISPR-associated endonuclease Csn1